MSREAMQMALEALKSVADHRPNDETNAAIAALKAALAEQKCPCGDRPADQCPGEWEPGCDLGANEKYAKKVAEQAQPVAWTPVSQAMPKSGAKVLACYRNRLGNLRRIRAEWIAAKTREADSEDAEACVEYDEATDTYYTTEGWYECIDNWGDYSSVAVTEGEVTHWMPLPPEPGAAPEALTQPAPKPLTEQEMYKIEDRARREFKLSQRGPRGQQITYWDSLTPWLIRAVEAEVRKRLGVRQ